MPVHITTTMSIEVQSVFSKQITLKKGKAMDNKEISSIVTSNNCRKGVINVPKDKGIGLKDSEVIKTRYGQIVKKTGQTIIHIAPIISPADILAIAPYVVQPTTLSHKNKHFFV